MPDWMCYLLTFDEDTYQRNRVPAHLVVNSVRE